MQLRILAISTTSKYPSVSYKSDTGIKSKEVCENFDHMKNLVPMINEVLPSPGAVDFIAVDIGPGSFVGTRIGVSTARAFSQMLDVPVIPVESLISLAYCDGLKADLICPMIDARNDTAYAACYGFEDFEPVALVKRDQYGVKEFILKIAEYVQTQKNKRVVFIGDVAQKKKALIEEASNGFSVFPMMKILREPNSKRVLKAACALAGTREMSELLSNGIAVKYDDVLPIYSRIAEAEKSLIKRGGRKIYIAPRNEQDNLMISSMEGELFDAGSGAKKEGSEFKFSACDENKHYINTVFSKGYSKSDLEKDMHGYLEELKKATSDKAIRFTLVMKEEKSNAVYIGGENITKAESIGFATLTLVHGYAEIERICIAKNRQNLGLGRIMLVTAMDVLRFLKAESVFLEVKAGNVSANKLYASNGFINTGRRKAYYKNGEDCLLMKKDLVN